MKTYTHETHVSPQRPNETDEGYSRRIADTLHNAAPELLQALRLVYANAGESPEWIRARIGSVISKAEGRA